MTDVEGQLTDRQQREREFHAEHARKHASRAEQAVNTDIFTSKSRRWWNAFWCMYDRILALGVQGKRVLIPGSGFGDDAIRLAHLGAEVAGFDLSPEIVDIARQRAASFGTAAIDFRVMPIETMDYPDNQFDLVIFVDILHHVDITRAMQEVTRVLKPGGMIIGDELYTHSSLQRIRESRIVAGSLYPLMRKWTYGTDTPYVTEDEHKIDEHEFAIVQNCMSSCDTDYFGVFGGRLFPNHLGYVSRADRILMRTAGPLKPVLGSRVVFCGPIRK